jgi:hypothetical protein
MRRGDGLRVRLARIRGETPSKLLRQPFYFPATIGDFEVDEESPHTEYDTVSAGRFSQPPRASIATTATQRRARPGLDDARFLQSLTLDVMVMDWDAPFLVEKGVTRKEMKDAIYPLFRSGAAFELLATLDFHDEPELRMFATMRSVRRTLRGGEVDTRYYAIALSQWRDPSVDRRTSTRTGRTHVTLPHRHKLRATDTLHSLSYEFYGTYEGWREIASRNGIRGIGQSYELVKSKRFKVGSIIVIPDVTFSRPAGEPNRGPRVPTSVLAPIAGE